MTIDELLVAVRRALDRVVINHGAEVELVGNEYWSLATGVAFHMMSSPDEFTVGQLTDDIQSIREFVESPDDEAIVIWHELAHIVGVLRGLEELDRRSI